LFREHSGRTNDFEIKEYATARYDNFEVENGLKNGQRPRTDGLNFGNIWMKIG
jgi:hypothetical protein